MSETATSAMHVIKKEDKQSVLRAFIAQDIEARRKVPAAEGATRTYCLVARSPDSPVARAVAELSDDLAALGISVYAVFATLGVNGSAVQRQKGNSDLDNVRQVQDQRLLDAHEVLLLDNQSSWIGDCMRRDPTQSDAYERFSNNCTFTNASALSAFEQLWNGARPAKSAWLSADRRQAQAIEPDQGLITNPAAMSPLEDAGLRAPATRH